MSAYQRIKNFFDIDRIEFEVYDEALLCTSKIYIKNVNSNITVDYYYDECGNVQTFKYEIEKRNWDNFKRALIFKHNIMFKTKKWFEGSLHNEIIYDDISYYVKIHFTNKNVRMYSGGTESRGIRLFLYLLPKYLGIDPFSPPDIYITEK
jgi:hypothetical protein